VKRVARIATTTLLLLSARAARAQQRPDSSGAITAIVTAAESGAPLGYSTLSVAARNIERLTDDRGDVTLRSLAPGPFELLVRHLGYAPRRVNVVVRAGASDTVRVALTHIAVSLDAMHVSAKRTCTEPGAPRASSDPAFATIFAQLELNAQAYRALVAEYPFDYDMQRRSAVRFVAGDESLQRFDTVHVNGAMDWHYTPGDVVDIASGPGNRQVVLNVPSLIHFAEPAFLANHCFYYAGRERVDTGRDTSLALRIDFLAWSRIKAPDIDGSLYLDPTTFQIVRSVLRLTKIPEETPQIATVTVTTVFQTVVPSIAIPRAIRSVHQLKVDSTRALLPATAYELQQLVRVRFVGAVPVGATVTPR
jgi:hypothetical protein